MRLHAHRSSLLTNCARPVQVMVLEQLLKHIREQEPTDKVVLVSNYTQALDLLQKVRDKQAYAPLQQKPLHLHTVGGAVLMQPPSCMAQSRRYSTHRVCFIVCLLWVSADSIYSRLTGPTPCRCAACASGSSCASTAAAA